MSAVLLVTGALAWAASLSSAQPVSGSGHGYAGGGAHAAAGAAVALRPEAAAAPGQTLPFTGWDIGSLAAAGIVLLVAGAGLLVVGIAPRFRQRL